MGQSTGTTPRAYDDTQHSDTKVFLTDVARSGSFGLPRRVIPEMKRFVASLWIAVLSIAAFCCFCQFSFDSLWPFTVATVLFATICHFRPSLRRASVALSVVALVAFTLDVTLLRHRLAIECRTWNPIWDGEDIADVLRSPSGRSTAYIVVGGFLDSANRTYISDRILFPKHCSIEADSTDSSYPKDFSASWEGAVFTVASVTYDETTGQLSTTQP
jgi:hypothetical protein